MKKTVIGLASDHAGYEAKEQVKEYLKQLGFTAILDFGTNSEESCDYPDFAHAMGERFESGTIHTGFIFCGSANGVNMTVNKYDLVRSALCWEVEIAEMARLHNDANVCAIPARYTTKEQVKEIVTVFLETEFEGGRHTNRVNKINK